MMLVNKKWPAELQRFMAFVSLQTSKDKRPTILSVDEYDDLDAGGLECFARTFGAQPLAPRCMGAVLTDDGQGR